MSDIRNLSSDRVGNAVSGLRGVIAGLEKDVKTKGAMTRINTSLDYALALIDDFMTVIDQQQKELARLKMADPRYQVVEVAALQRLVHETLEEVSGLAVLQPDSPVKKALETAYKVITILNSKSKMVFVADIEGVKNSSGYSELMGWFNDHIMALGAREDADAINLRAVFNEMVKQLQAITKGEGRIADLEKAAKAHEKIVSDLTMERDAIEEVKKATFQEANDLRALLKQSGEELVAVRGQLASSQLRASALHDLIGQREQELTGTRVELNNALRQLDGTHQEAKDVKRQPSEVPLLAIEQPGANSGFWVVNRDWHDQVVERDIILLRSREDREKYEGQLRNAVMALARSNGLNKDIREMFCKVVLVDWDDFFKQNSEGATRFGPVFSAGTLKLLELGSQETKPEEPKVPNILSDKQPQMDRKVWLLNNEFIKWFKEKNSSWQSMEMLPNRNFFRVAVAERINAMLGKDPTAKLPIVVIDWDMATTDMVWFVTPEVDMTNYILKGKFSQF